MSAEPDHVRPLGAVVMTPGVERWLVDDPDNFLPRSQVIMELLRRHARGDDGDVDPQDHAANVDAWLDGDRVHSAYEVPDFGRVWVITEADRSSTCVLLPSEY